MLALRAAILELHFLRLLQVLRAVLSLARELLALLAQFVRPLARLHKHLPVLLAFLRELLLVFAMKYVGTFCGRDRLESRFRRGSYSRPRKHPPHREPLGRGALRCGELKQPLEHGPEVGPSGGEEMVKCSAPPPSRAGGALARAWRLSQEEHCLAARPPTAGACGARRRRHVRHGMRRQGRRRLRQHEAEAGHFSHAH